MLGLRLQIILQFLFRLLELSPIYSNLRIHFTSLLTLFFRAVKINKIIIRDLFLFLNDFIINIQHPPLK